MTRDFETSAQTAWSALSEKVDGADENAILRVLSARVGRKQQWRVVAHAAATTDYILKLWLPNGAQKAEHAFLALGQAQIALQDYPRFHAPLPVAWDAATGSVLMHKCAGAVLRDVMMAGTEEGVADRLRLALAWLAALHHSTLDTALPFGGMQKLRALQRDGLQRGVVEPEQFDACLGALARLEESAAQSPNPTAIAHGDLTLSNLLIEGEHVCGIDFYNLARTSVALDLAMLLTEAVVVFGQARDAPAFSLLPQDWTAVAVKTYPHLSVESDMFKFFAGVRLLRMWAQTRTAVSDHGPRQAHLWHGVRTAACRLLLGRI